MKSAQQQAVVAEISLEIDNVRLAWQWAAAHRRTADIRRLVRTIYAFYEVRGWLQQGVAIFALAATSLQAASAAQADVQAEDEIALGQVLTWQGYFLHRSGQLTQAREVLRRSLALLRRRDDRAALVDALLYLGVVAYQVGDYPESRRWLEEALTIGRMLDHRWHIASALSFLGIMVHALGEYREAESLFREALALWRAFGNPSTLAFCLNFFCNTLYMLGEYREAQTLLRESLTLSIALNDRSAWGQALNHLGLVAQALGEYPEAHYLFYESLALYKQIGNLWGVVRALNHLGAVSWARDDHAESQRYFLEALATAMEVKAVPLALDALVGIAAVRTKAGAAEPALELAAYILHHPASSKETQERAAQLRADVEAQLTPPQIEAAQARAQAQTFEALAAEILGAPL